TGGSRTSPAGRRMLVPAREPFGRTQTRSGRSERRAWPRPTLPSPERMELPPAIDRPSVRGALAALHRPPLHQRLLSTIRPVATHAPPLLGRTGRTPLPEAP